MFSVYCGGGGSRDLFAAKEEAKGFEKDRQPVRVKLLVLLFLAFNYLLGLAFGLSE